MAKDDLEQTIEMKAVKGLMDSLSTQFEIDLNTLDDRENAIYQIGCLMQATAYTNLINERKDQFKIDINDVSKDKLEEFIARWKAAIQQRSLQMSMHKKVKDNVVT